MTQRVRHRRERRKENVVAKHKGSFHIVVPPQENDEWVWERRKNMDSLMKKECLEFLIIVIKTSLKLPTFFINVYFINLDVKITGSCFGMNKKSKFILRTRIILADLMIPRNALRNRKLKNDLTNFISILLTRWINPRGGFFASR